MLEDSGALVVFERPLALLFFALGFLAIFYRYRQMRRQKTVDRVLAEEGRSPNS